MVQEAQFLRRRQKLGQTARPWHLWCRVGGVGARGRSRRRRRRPR
jgi:hypothetical protein